MFNTTYTVWNDSHSAYTVPFSSFIGVVFLFSCIIKPQPKETRSTYNKLLEYILIVQISDEYSPIQFQSPSTRSAIISSLNQANFRFKRHCHYFSLNIVKTKMYMYSVLYSVYNYIYIGHTLKSFHKKPRVSAFPVSILLLLLLLFFILDGSYSHNKSITNF